MMKEMVAIENDQDYNDVCNLVELYNFGHISKISLLDFISNLPERDKRGIKCLTYIETHIDDKDPEVIDRIKKEYKTYEVKAVLSYNILHKEYRDDIKFISLNEKKGELKVKNNTNDNLRCVKYGLLYYDDNDQIIGYSEVYEFDNIKAHKTITKKIYIEDISYSRIEVILLEAYINT